MSRIHEALRRAESEREGRGPGAAAEPVPASTAAHIASAQSLAQEPGPLGPLEPAAVPPMPASDGGVLPGAELRSRCRAAKWSPDLRSMLFFASSKNSTGTEEFRTLRSRLYQLRQQRPLQRVLVTSALPEEGKSFVAANLAQVIVQQQGRTALLVDADLRGSVLHQRLGAPRSPGLGECLKGEAQEWTAIQSGPMENLFFLPAGGPVSNPAELLHSEGLAPLLQRLAASFDWIVIDSPPVVPVSDASLLADLCDGVLLVVQADNTPRDMAQKARQEFRHHAVLGVVLNRAQDNATYHRYYYGGGRPEKDTQG